MARYSERELKDAAAFRGEIHREALARAREICPGVGSVTDPYPAEAYIRQVWDYPGAWYNVTAIPEGAGSRAKLIDAIVRATVEGYRRSAWTAAGAAPEDEAEEAVPGEADFRCPEDPFYALLARYPACVLDCCILTAEPSPGGGETAHRAALAAACRRLLAPEGWSCRPSKARGRRIGAGELFAPVPPGDGLNYRRAFLHPPRETGYTDADFDRVNAALFPRGTASLEVYAWTTDWSDYFDEGHEWWGALCLTVYDGSLDRYAVILASATD